MSLCDTCTWSPQYCRARIVKLVSDAELDSNTFRTDVRSFVRDLRVPPTSMLDFLSDCFRDSECAKIVNDSGEAIEFELDELEFDNFPYWIRDLLRLPVASTPTRLRSEKREAFRTLATLLRVIFPAETQLWGIRAGNDNMSMSPANDNDAE